MTIVESLARRLDPEAWETEWSCIGHYELFSKRRTESLNRAKASFKTKDGCPVLILVTDLKHQAPIVGISTYPTGRQYIGQWDALGNCGVDAKQLVEA